MPIELIKNPLKVCRIIGENVFSSVIEEDINVPDANPDVFKVLAPSAVVLIGECEMMNDKVQVSGQIQMNVLYSADLEGKPMDGMDIVVSFSEAIEIPDARPKMKENVSVVIQHVECTLINSRKVSIRVILDIMCRVEEVFDLELASDVRGLPDIQVLREPSSFMQVMGYKKDVFEIHEDVKLPPEMPELEKVLKSCIHITMKEEKVLDGKIETSGFLGVNVMYQSAEEKDNIHNHAFEIPFSQTIEVPAAERGMVSTTDMALAAFSVAPIESLMGEKRGLNVHTGITANTKVYKDSQEDVVVDAYSPSSSVNYNRDVFKMSAFVGKGRGSTVIKESISISRGDPEIENVYSVDLTPVINEVRLMDDRVLVEGILDCTAIYASDFSGEPLCSMNEQIPFKHYADVVGTKLGMAAITKCAIESLAFALLNSETIEFRLVLNVSAEVMKPVEKKMISEIEYLADVALDLNSLPTVTIYLVQKGDSLWSIAKRYHTTVDALVQLNQIENPLKIVNGMQLLILKTVRVGVSVS